MIRRHASYTVSPRARLFGVPALLESPACFGGLALFRAVVTDRPMIRQSCSHSSRSSATPCFLAMPLLTMRRIQNRDSCSSLRQMLSLWMKSARLSATRPSSYFGPTDVPERTSCEATCRPSRVSGRASTTAPTRTANVSKRSDNSSNVDDPSRLTQSLIHSRFTTHHFPFTMRSIRCFGLLAQCPCGGRCQRSLDEDADEVRAVFGGAAHVGDRFGDFLG